MDKLHFSLCIYISLAVLSKVTPSCQHDNIIITTSGTINATFFFPQIEFSHKLLPIFTERFLPLLKMQCRKQSITKIISLPYLHSNVDMVDISIM